MNKINPHQDSNQELQKQQECLVCLVNDKDQRVCLNCCGKGVSLIHQKCYEIWLNYNNYCPICRAPVTNKSLTISVQSESVESESIPTESIVISVEKEKEVIQQKPIWPIQLIVILFFIGNLSYIILTFCYGLHQRNGLHIVFVIFLIVHLICFIIMFLIFLDDYAFQFVVCLIIHHIIFILLAFTALADNQDPLVICAISSSLVFILQYVLFLIFLKMYNYKVK